MIYISVKVRPDTQILLKPALKPLHFLRIITKLISLTKGEIRCHGCIIAAANTVCVINSSASCTGIGHPPAKTHVMTLDRLHREVSRTHIVRAPQGDTAAKHLDINSSAAAGTVIDQQMGKTLQQRVPEAVQAIDLEDTEKLYDELGDVLLQVVFHAQMGKDMGEFDISDVTTAVCAKLIRRHPHIFGDVKADNSEEVLKNWDNIKKGEKHFSRQSEVLRDIPKELPALLRTTKVLKKMAKTPYPLPSAEESAAKLSALVNEPQGQMGELLLHAVNLANSLGDSAEVELNHTLNDLIDRFTQWEENNIKA